MNTAIKERMRFARALRSRSFALIWGGQAISALGDGAYLIAALWQVLLLTHSAIAIGTFMVAGSTPIIFFLLFGGVIADRLPRRLVLLWSDSLRAIVVLLIAALGWLHLLQFWHLVILAFLFSIADGFFLPAYQAIPPQLVDTDQLASANTLIGINQQMSILIGPLLAAGFLAWQGPASAFAFDGVTFIASALCLFAARVPKSIGSPEPSPAAFPAGEANAPAARSSLLQSAQSVLHDVGEGLSYVTHTTWLWVSILVASLVNIGLFGTLQVGLPKLVDTVYGSGSTLFGIIVTLDGIGATLGALLVGQIQHLPRRGIVGYAAMGVSSIAVVVFGLPLPRVVEIAVALVAALAFGIGMGAFGVIWATLLQELVPGDKLGRVSSVDMLGSFCLRPVGYAVLGFLIDQLGPSWIFRGAGLIDLALVGIALSVRDIQKLE